MHPAGLHVTVHVALLGMRTLPRAIERHAMRPQGHGCGSVCGKEQCMRAQVKAGRFSEDEARYFFQQLISGVEYCHSQVQEDAAAAPALEAEGRACPACRVTQSLHARRKAEPVLALLCAGGSMSGRCAIQGHCEQAIMSAVASVQKLFACPLAIPPHRSRRARAGRVPPRPEAGEHAAGRPPRAAPQDLRLRLLQVGRLRLAAQVHRRHARLHCPRGAHTPHRSLSHTGYGLLSKGETPCRVRTEDRKKQRQGFCSWIARCGVVCAACPVGWYAPMGTFGEV